MTSDKSLYLGTALWGWSVDKATAFSLLDTFYSAGHRFIDTATNYPINKDPSFFRFAENTIAEWLSQKMPEGVKIIVKIGSLSNDGSPIADLSPSFIHASAVYYRRLFGTALDSLWIHWDNRDNPKEISETLNALAETFPGSRIGLSGIKCPEAYREVLKNKDWNLDIQVKHNLFTSDMPRYAALSARSHFLAYGINAGGVGLSRLKQGEKRSINLRGIDTEKYAGRINTLNAVIANSKGRGFSLNDLNELALLHSLSEPKIQGAIIGPSNNTQLETTLNFFKKISNPESRKKYQDILREIR